MHMCSACPGDAGEGGAGEAAAEAAQPQVPAEVYEAMAAQSKVEEIALREAEAEIEEMRKAAGELQAANATLHIEARSAGERSGMASQCEEELREQELQAMRQLGEWRSCREELEVAKQQSDALLSEHGQLESRLAEEAASAHFAAEALREGSGGVGSGGYSNHGGSARLELSPAASFAFAEHQATPSAAGIGVARRRPAKDELREAPTVHVQAVFAAYPSGAPASFNQAQVPAPPPRAAKGGGRGQGPRRTFAPIVATRSEDRAEAEVAEAWRGHMAAAWEELRCASLARAQEAREMEIWRLEAQELRRRLELTEPVERALSCQRDAVQCMVASLQRAMAQGV